MLRSLKYLEGYTVHATDGDLGTVVDFLFDDVRWTARYLVVDTGTLMKMREVLVSPESFRHIDWSTRRFHVALTMDKVRDSPSISVHEPVSRQHEHDYCAYFGYTDYWGYWSETGAAERPLVYFDTATEAAGGDMHLRSAGDVRGYHIEGTDGQIGHIHDFIVDDATWEIRYLVLATSHWWMGKHVLIAPRWATRISWLDRRVHVDLPRDTIKKSPSWNPDLAVNREYETRLYDYYGRPVYWASQDQPVRPSPP